MAEPPQQLGLVPAPPDKFPKSAPPPACVICYDTELDQLVRACRVCPSYYCRSCLVEMFEAAITTPSRFPPRCCALVQLFTVLPDIDPETASQYREKLEEWLTVTKTYCPSKTCSAFIPPRLIPTRTRPEDIPLHEVLTNLLEHVHQSPNARFFRGDIEFSTLPKYETIVAHPIHLGDIQDKIDAAVYSSVSEMAQDMSLLVANANHYNGPNHPVSKAADDLFALFIDTLWKKPGLRTCSSKAPEALQSGDLFPCPACHIAICTACKQVEHRGTPCGKDDSYELAILEKFGYRQCPRCHHAIKRMYGCPHMQCACGAHFCWVCLKSVDECNGNCEDDVNAYDDELEGEDDDDEDNGDDSGFIEGAPPATNALTNGTNTTQPNTVQERQNPQNEPHDLDAGGYRRWHNHDLGEEPGEDPVIQVWSCHHYWAPFRSPEDGLDHGNLEYLECNYCFKSLKPANRRKEPPAARRQSSKAGTVSKEDEAWDCYDCRVIACLDCKAKKQEAGTEQ